MANAFSVPVFFIVFRETLEAAIIISVLLAFIKQSLGTPTTEVSDITNHPEYDPENPEKVLSPVEVSADSSSGDAFAGQSEAEKKELQKKLIRQVWFGAGFGLLICFVLGGTFIGVFYSLDKNLWSSFEDLWEGIFCVIATVMITFMGLAMLRINKMKEKWRVKIAKTLLQSKGEYKDTSFKGRLKSIFNFRYNSKKYALGILAFVTTLREGIEAVVFVGGVGLGEDATAFPLPVFCGLAAGGLIGYFIYRGGNFMSIQIFLIASTCFLYLIAAGLFSRAIWYFQMYRFAKKAGGDVAEGGSGPGSYNVYEIVWHVNCCDPLNDGGWQIFNALFGWQNSPTYGSVISYNVYWICIIAAIFVMLFNEKHGYYPLMKRWAKKEHKEEDDAIYDRAVYHARQDVGVKNGAVAGESQSSEDERKEVA